MAVGKRVKITFLEGAFAKLPSSSHSENYTEVLTDWAVARMRNSTRTDIMSQTQFKTIYVFSEIRQRTGFTPNKKQLIQYNGLNLTIDTIVLHTDTLPYYYTITASENA